MPRPRRTYSQATFAVLQCRGSGRGPTSVQCVALQADEVGSRPNKTGAARLLGITVGALRYRLEKLGMEA